MLHINIFKTPFHQKSIKVLAAHLFHSFTAAGNFSQHENHIDTRNSAVKELVNCHHKLKNSNLKGFFLFSKRTSTP